MGRGDATNTDNCLWYISKLELTLEEHIKAPSSKEGIGEKERKGRGERELNELNHPSLR